MTSSITVDIAVFLRVICRWIRGALQTTLGALVSSDDVVIIILGAWPSILRAGLFLVFW